MHPQRELNRLARRKAALLGDLDRQRGLCRGAVDRLRQPLAWTDRVLEIWELVRPGVRATATEAPGAPRPAGIATGLRWAGLGLGALRLVVGALARRSAKTPPGPASGGI